MSRTMDAIELQVTNAGNTEITKEIGIVNSSDIKTISDVIEDCKKLRDELKEITDSDQVKFFADSTHQYLLYYGQDKDFVGLLIALGCIATQWVLIGVIIAAGVTGVTDTATG